MAANDKLVLSAADLARAAPQHWDRFLAEFKAYTGAQKDLCVQAPAEGLQVTQGRARQCVQLLELLENSVKVADQIRNGRATK